MWPVAAPMLCHDHPVRASQHVPQDECCDDRVIQGTCDRNELRDQVDRRDQPGEADRQDDLARQRHALVAREAMEQPDQVRKQMSELTREPVAAGQHKDQDHREPDRDRDQQTRQQAFHLAESEPQTCPFRDIRLDRSELVRYP